MFNVKVFRIKDIFKYAIRLITCMLFIYIGYKYFGRIQIKNIEKISNVGIDVESQVEKVTQVLKLGTIEKILNQTLPGVGIEDESKEKYSFSDIAFFEKAFENEIISAAPKEETKEEITKTDTKEEIVKENENVEELPVVDAVVGLETKVVTPNPLQEVFHNTYGSVKIKNESGYPLTQEQLEPNVVIENKNILIFNTHSCESYTPTEEYNYVQTGNFRSTDTKYNVTGVATELNKYLTNYGYNIIQNQTYHDYPLYTGSYSRSLESVTKELETNQADIIFDIHRDAIGSISDYAPSVQIGDEVAAQLMFVIGTDAGGLSHSNWVQNLKFAIKVQEKAEELYPGLFKPIFLTNSRYNQHMGSYASIIEVGATGNTMEQALVSMKYLAKVLSEVIE